MKRGLIVLLVFPGITSFSQQEEEYPDVEIQQENDYEKYFMEKWSGENPVLHERNIPPEKVAKLKKNKSFWYADHEFKDEVTELPDQVADYVPLMQRTWFQTLVWLIIIGGFAATVMWFLASSQVGLFRKKEVKSGIETNTDEIPEDIFAIQYQHEIEKAIRAGNYRLAVRLMYLRLLKSMSEKNIIQYKQDRTNLDYLLQLQPTGYYKDFFRITRNYEYSWYGLFDVSREAYDIIRSDFNQFERRIN